MACALCLGELSLKRSHIIPEFMYRAMYDPMHRFQLFSIDPLRSDKYEQKGLREDLLCGDCEARFSAHERYISQVFAGEAQLDYLPMGPGFWVRGIDYTSLRLFQLSILWRASVSKLPFFSGVNLGRHQEKIRRLLLGGDPGAPHRYGCMMCVLSLDGRTQDEWVLQPTCKKVDGIRNYRFVFGGIYWCYLVSSHRPLNIEVERAFINTNGEMYVLQSEITSLDFIVKYMHRFLGNERPQ